MLKQGDKIVFNGQEVTIHSVYAAGKHKQFILSNGDVALDLDKRELEVIKEVPRKKYIEKEDVSDFFNKELNDEEEKA